MSSPAPSTAHKCRIAPVGGEYVYFDSGYVNDAIEELKTKAVLVRAKVDSFSKAETIAYWILDKGGYFEEPPLSSDEIEQMKCELADPWIQ